MSYNVTITAQSLEELADKALALGGRLTLASVRQTVTAAEIAEVAMQAEPAYAPPVEVVEVNPAAPAKPPKAAKAAPAKAEAEIPDYATVVGPAVLALAQTKGKPAAQAILARYNATKADQVPPEKWAALVAELNAVRGA